MKLLRHLTIVAAVGAVALPVAWAQTAPAPVPPPAQSHVQPGAAAKAHARQAFRKLIAGRIAHSLQLTANQQAQLKAVRAHTAAAIKGIRADTTLTPTQKLTKVRAAVTVGRKQGGGVLTEKQREKLTRITQRMHKLMRAMQQ